MLQEHRCKRHCVSLVLHVHSDPDKCCCWPASETACWEQQHSGRPCAPPQQQQHSGRPCALRQTLRTQADPAHHRSANPPSRDTSIRPQHASTWPPAAAPACVCFEADLPSPANPAPLVQPLAQSQGAHRVFQVLLAHACISFPLHWPCRWEASWMPGLGTLWQGSAAACAPPRRGELPWRRRQGWQLPRCAIVA